MSPQPLPRSFKRKYKKLHSQFTIVQSDTILLDEDLKTSTATALKLIADNDMLLDLLGDLRPVRNTISVDDQLAIYMESEDALYGPNEEESEFQPVYYTREEPPEHFESLPWDMDRHSFTGSHLEDLAKAVSASAAAAAATATAGAVETPGPAPSAKTQKNKETKQTSSKKRERTEVEEEVNGTSSRKKKRKSIVVPASDVWDE